jgi:hypothetical protein
MDADGNSEARIGWGSGFYLEDTPGGTLTEIDEVTGTIPFGDETGDDVEVTHFKSPNKRKEYIRGLIEAGTGTLTVNYIPGSPTDTLLRTAHSDGLTRAFRAVLPDEAGDPAWQVDGFLLIKSRGRAVPIGGKMEATYTVRFTGGSTEAAA